MFNSLYRFIPEAGRTDDLLFLIENSDYDMLAHPDGPLRDLAKGKRKIIDDVVIVNVTSLYKMYVPSIALQLHTILFDPT